MQEFSRCLPRPWFLRVGNIDGTDYVQTADP